MAKKKRHHPDAAEVLQRPWCYYCERDFDDLKILIDHQKAKHFKCERCGRRLNTAGGLSVHMSQVHKENLTAVDNALPNRAGLDIEIFGMEGIPEEIVLQHNQRVLTQFHQAEAERRAATGNPTPGAQGNNPAKKVKTEDVSDLKKRLAEHKAAKLAAEQNAGGSSGSATPVGAGQSQPPAQQSPYQPSPASFQPYQQPYAPPPSTVALGQPPVYLPVHTQPSYQASAYPQAASPVYGQPPAQPPYQHPYAQPPQPSFQQQSPSFPPQPTFSPPPFQAHPPYPGQPFPPQPGQNGHPSFHGQPVGVPRPFGAGSPPISHQPQQTQQLQQRTHSPAQNGLPQRNGSASLPTAPGLPQRPAFGAPPVNAFQFQQMHQGQLPAPPNHLSPSHHGGPSPHPNNTVSSAGSPETPNAASIDDLISSASKQADATAAAVVDKANTPQPPQTAPASTTASQEATKELAAEDKSGKKEKEKPKQTRLVYSDNEVSPEEKMARMAKYAFTPQQTIAV